jgi:zinc and cadmium transporter
MTRTATLPRNTRAMPVRPCVPTTNALSASSAVAGAGAAYAFLGDVQSAIPVVMSVSAASFVYVALTDLFPELHREEDRKRGTLQVVLLLAGIATVALLGQTEH